MFIVYQVLYCVYYVVTHYLFRQCRKNDKPLLQCSAVVPVFSAIVSVCKYNLTDEKSEHILHSELISQTPSPVPYP